MKVFSLIFAMLLSFGPVSAYDPMLIGGRPALKGEFPEIVYIRSGNARCSASVISPRGETGVILTAGHCVADQGEIGPVSELVDFVVGQTVYRAKCRQAPLYRAQTQDHDMALCKVDKALDVVPASISGVGPMLGVQVTLTGYGCINPGGGAGNDGILRVGKAKVVQLPAGNDHWFYTKDRSALCFGDSGGPALLRVAKGRHTLIGVNSRGNIQDTSLMTALFTTESKKFFEEFIVEQEVKICGINQNC